MRSCAGKFDFSAWPPPWVPTSCILGIASDAGFPSDAFHTLMTNFFIQ
jgi:hypothetical protein